MVAPKGNQFWKARASHGRDLIFETPEILWEACEEYFQWVEDNPLKEQKVFAYQGEVSENGYVEVDKMRAMTISGLCLFLDISETTWDLYRRRKDFVGVTSQAERVIYNQKFSGASADLLNANIIARDLGLKDQQETKHSGNIGFTDLSEDELDRKIQELEQKAEQSGDV
jgi:hypothetical protein